MDDELIYLLGLLAAIGLYVIWRVSRSAQEQDLHPPVTTAWGQLFWHGESYSMLRFKDGSSFRVVYSGETIQPQDVSMIEALLSRIDQCSATAIEFARQRDWPEGCTDPRLCGLAIAPSGDFDLSFDFEWPYPGIVMKIGFRNDQPSDFSWRWLESAGRPRYGT